MNISWSRLVQISILCFSFITVSIDEFHNDKETSLKNIDKISFVETDVGARVSLKCEETGVPGENTRGRTGRNLVISRIAPGSNPVRIGLECICNTVDCQHDNKKTCRVSSSGYCYSETIEHPGYESSTTRGCINKKTPLLCENRRPSKLHSPWPVLHCCKKDFCNRDVIPTPPPVRPQIEDRDYGQVQKQGTTQSSSKCSVYEPNNGSSKMINPIYIAVPIAGVCVLLALVIFAMYLLRRRNDYYERYNYPRTVPVPQHHITCNEAKCANACKLNRCTDSERSSSGSETKLFI